ncbi:MAG: hypothetical protein K6G81_04635 [Lachnospiraceae bacterium]|nr:hypothetical protein [Lachnospiraceae bacterium]
MKTFRKIMGTVLALAMVLALTGCGYELKIDLTSLKKPVVSQITYYTEKELKTDTGAYQRNIYLEAYEAGEITYEALEEECLEMGMTKKQIKGKTAEELLEVLSPDSGQTGRDMIEASYPGSKLEEVKKNGEKLYKLEKKFVKSDDSSSDTWYVDADTGEETYLEPQIISANSKKAEMFMFDSYKTDTTSTEGSLSTTYDFYDLTAKLPFKVYYTNGTKDGKKGVSFGSEFASGQERCVAVADKKTFDVKKITAKMETMDFDTETGEYKAVSSKTVKDGKTYKTGSRLAISSKNAIKVFTVNDTNIADNCYTFNEAGKYKVKIVLANDTAMNFTIKIK